MVRRLIGILLGVALFTILSNTALCHAQQTATSAKSFYQAYVVAPSYDYELSGRKDRIKGYVIKVDSPEQLSSPGLVVLC